MSARCSTRPACSLDGAPRLDASSRRAFTIIELLVVITVIAIAATVILPGFGRLVESNNYSSAINSVTAALGNARARAISTGRPTGVAFFFDLETERSSLQILELVGRDGGVLTNRVTSPPPHTYCHAFRPALLSQPELLPKGTGVYALARTHVRGSVNGQPQVNLTIDRTPTYQWYAGEVINDGLVNPPPIVPWIFPRTDPRMFTARDTQGTARNVFYGLDPWAIVTRGPGASWPAPTGGGAGGQEAVRNVTTFFILFDDRGRQVEATYTGGEESVNAYLELPTEPYPATSTDFNPEPYDNLNRFDPENFGEPAVDGPDRRPNREVMLRAASQLAVVDLQRLAEQTAIARPWLVRSENSKVPMPDYLREAGYSDNDKVQAVSRWIALNAEIIGFNPYTGNVLRRSVR